ncbi:VOC family protein [Allosaccharopolyspora coralli]|uniref:VOC family protein n=1 Tax=Allosaccharopolyspora coralli TaxID=2665642 RepID=A0A5Q3Q1J1_9PSEU|nr:VOC family protein [Allosaccharopolyspora coralli]QGK68193.1 VOC family protein [Allosaccharopolyspora coralli]
MTSRMAVLSIDAVDPSVIARFWCEVLGWSIIDVEDADEVIEIGPADGSWPTIDVPQVPEHKAVKNRLHLDIRADGVSTEDELTRLLGLGARRVDVGQRPDVPWVVLADPEGNEFCLLPRTVEQATAVEPT